MASPEEYAQFRKGFNKGTDPLAIANQAAQGYQQALPPSQPGSLPSPEASQGTNMHMLNMQQRAEEAKQKYMQENGVDENGNTVQAAE